MNRALSKAVLAFVEKIHWGEPSGNYRAIPYHITHPGIYYSSMAATLQKPVWCSG